MWPNEGGRESSFEVKYGRIREGGRAVLRYRNDGHMREGEQF